MGCSNNPKTKETRIKDEGISKGKEYEKKTKENNAYTDTRKNIQFRINSMSRDEPKISEGFLLGASSIQKFIKIIDDPKNSKQSNEQKELNNKKKDIKRPINNEDLKNIEIFSDYKKCKKLIFTNKKEKNSFFIVDEDFLKKNNLSNMFGQNTKVEIDKINKKIKFPSTEVLKFRKKKGNDFCEFVDNNDDGNKNNKIKNNINKTGMEYADDKTQNNSHIQIDSNIKGNEIFIYNKKEQMNINEKYDNLQVYNCNSQVNNDNNKKVNDNNNELNKLINPNIITTIKLIKSGENAIKDTINEHGNFIKESENNSHLAVGEECKIHSVNNIQSGPFNINILFPI